MLAYLVGILAFFQVQNYSIDFYNTQKGLSNNIVYDIHQDQQGFIWVATENGLNRFDAYEFKTFYHKENDLTTISSNVVRAIYENKEGELWLGTRQGINLFDKKTETFTRFSVPEFLNINYNDVLDLEPDSKDNLWFILQSRLVVFNIEEKAYKEISLPFLAYDFAVDANDLIWISGYEGELYSYDIKAKELQEVSQTNPDINLSFFLSRDRRTILYNPVGESVESPNWEKLPAIGDNNKVERLYEDSNGNKWLTFEENLYLQSEIDGSLKKVNLSENSEPILSIIKAITEDESGGIWVGTNDGLYRIKTKEKNFEKLNGGANLSVAMAIEEIGNTWWVNNFSKGLSRYIFDEMGRLISSLEIDLENGINQIWDIESVSESKLWLATEQGLFEMDVNTQQISMIINFDEERDYDVFFTINKIEDDIYWVGGYSIILKINAANHRVLEKADVLDDYEGVLIQDITPVEDGLLVVTETHGLFHYSNELGFQKIWKEKEIPSQLDQISIWELYQAKDGTLWFGGNNGLYSVDSYESFSNPINVEIGENVIVFSITEDKDELLWLGTDRGLIRYNPVTKEARLFDLGDDFVNPEFNRRSIFTSESGTIVAGGMSGTVYFNPKEININQDEPRVWITAFDIISPDSTKELIMYGRDNIDLNWKENTFEINFTALNYTNSLQNQYRYKLENYDPDWVSPEESRLARYVQVPAGEYVFKVIASNNDGIWNETGDFVSIRINPPFWQTIWFRVLVLIIVFVIAWTLYRFRVKQLLEVERVRLRIAGDLHDEIGSGLSGIALTGDLLQSQVKDGNPRPEMVQKISGNARALASSLDSIVWLIDPNKESLLDLLIKCKRTARDLLPKHELVIKDEVPESLHTKELESGLRRGFYLILKEAVHNIHKHAKAKKVQIRFSIENREFRVTITDNGIGFNEEEVLKGKGIDSFRKRAEEMGGSFIIKSEYGKGTEIIIQKELP